MRASARLVLSELAALGTFLSMIEVRLGRVRLQPDGFFARVGTGASNCDMSHSLAGRRLAARRALRHRLVAILYSQVRSDARSSVNPPMPCQAASIVSWTASSASWRDPSIR